MGCDFEIGGDGEEFDHYEIGIAVSCGETLRCCECSITIQPGQDYEKVIASFAGDGRVSHVYSTCLSCAEIAEAFVGDIRIHGGLWEAMAEASEETPITTACYGKLKSAAAKRALQRFAAERMALDLAAEKKGRAS